MRRSARVLLTALLAVLLIAPLVPVTTAQAALVSRSEFTSWTTYSDGTPDLALSADGLVTHSGDASIRADYTSPIRGGSYGGLYQVVAVQPSTTYTVSGFVKAKDVADTQADRIILSLDWQRAQYFDGGTYDWTPFSWTVTTGASETVLPVQLLVQNTGTLWLDDLSVVKEGTTANLLANAGFENFADRIVVEAPSMIFAPGRVRIPLSSSAPTIGWTLIDDRGVVAAAGDAATDAGSATIDATLPVGYYTLRMTAREYTTDTSLAVVADLATKPTSLPPAYGITAHPEYTSLPDPVDPLRSVGLGSVRFDLRWQLIEPTKGNYTFTNPIDYISLFARLRAKGIRPLVILGYSNPLYDNDVRPYTDAGRTAYANYAAAIARQFGTDVDYEIYNEYNHPTGYALGPCGAAVECYEKMFTRAASAIKAVAPKARIVMTGLAGNTAWWLGGSGDAAFDGIAMKWLKAFLASPASKDLDVVNIHNYGFPNAPEGQNDTIIRAVRALMAQYPAHRGKQLWLTETGWPTVAGSALNTEAEQAKFLVRDIAQSRTAGADRYMLYDLFNDYAEETGEGRFGILRNPAAGAGLTPKPAYVTYAVLTRTLGNATPAGRDALGSQVNSEIFRSGAARTRVLWAKTPTTVTVALPTGATSVTVTDLYGTTRRMAATEGRIALTLTDEPLYLTTSTDVRISLGSNGISASTSAQAVQNRPVTVTVGVDLRRRLTPSPSAGPVTFSVAGTSVKVTPTPGNVATARLTLPAFAEPGAKSIPVQVSQRGRTIGLLTILTTVVANPVISVRPAVNPAGVGPLDLTIRYLSDPRVTVSSVDYTVGSVRARLEPGTPLGDEAVTIPLPVDTVEAWAPVDYRITVTLSDGLTRTVTGTTAFATALTGDPASPPKADLATSAIWRTVGGSDDGPADHSGSMWVSHSATTVTVHADVIDNAQSVGPSPDVLWQGDSIQFAFSSDHPTASSPFASFGAALLADGPVVYRFSGVGQVVTDATTTITRDEATKTTHYAVTLPLATAGIAPDAQNLSYSFLVNDNDNGSRKGYLEWASGIGNLAGPPQYLPIQLG